MKRVRIPLAIALILITFIITPFSPRAAGVAVADIGSLSSTLESIERTFADVKDSLDGIQRFASGIAAVWRAISAVIDPRALALLAAVLIVSAGFSALGVPKGRTCFLVSLVFVNALWLLWGRSMNPDSIAFIPGMIKINIYLLLPYFLIVISAHFLPIIIRRAVRAFGRGLDREEAQLLVERFDDESARARESIVRDLSAHEGERIRLSHISRSHLGELLRIIKKIQP